jgi:hypothetical protein
MHNELVGTPSEKHLKPKRSFLRKLVSRMRPEVVNGTYQRIAPPQGQGQIKPRVESLIVNHVRRKLLYPAKNLPNREELATGLPQSGALEGK